jgi:Protein phosphatase 2C
MPWFGKAKAPPGPSADAWRVIGSSVLGASHARAGLGNQDAIGWIPADGVGARVVVSVADGHGSPKCFRSTAGARLAVEVSQALAAELLTVPGGRVELSWVKDRLEQDAPRRIVREWRARVEEDLARSPFADEEFASVRDREGQKALALVEADPYLAYGSTLVTAVATQSFMAFWQIGDGDVLTVSASGSASRPLAGDERLIANETTSLCSADAWRLFRVAVFGTPAPVILVSTDGFANSFRDDEGYFRFGSDVLRMLIMEGVDVVGGRLTWWLGEMTQAGSGDDISLGIACRPSDFPESLPELVSRSDAASLGDGEVSSHGPGHRDRTASQDATAPGAPEQRTRRLGG